ncbi:carbon storage regulator CsrA [Paenibacillus sp. MER 180]|uniref:carbon storage regulator CsrA n=1 Tax=Paenibacillus sp. MER 180 TaxID=2939570 RepID=UPI002041643C|nr:carbon storage regulator CsrA [Paenibacillus sp. MER 180]MCM3288568.1 carbon storage regulator CsrA [Paenibacillus sp. MER 180]
MLILTRKKGQSIMLDQNIEIHIASVEGDQVKIGIKAPKDVVVLRKELVEEIVTSNQEAAAQMFDIQLLKKAKKR